jgi:uncharacterized protein YecA (UPF0149 family)
MGFIEKIAGIFGSKSSRQGDLQRNDPCWCGSGKKYKKCHYESDRKKSFGKAVKKKPS